MNYKIKNAKRIDADFIKDIYKAEKEHLGSFNLYQCWDNYLRKKSKEKFWVVKNLVKCPVEYVEYQDNVGFVRFGWSKKFHSFILQDIGILEKYKRKGVGKFIIDNLPRPLILKCNIDNTNGNKFYKKIGMTLNGVTMTKKGVKQNVWSI
jgi:predicted acetyltransferase|tara:strand:+ start:341 stop:790 length:450 start_codon:yes stop_codon:yes gene_type:complete